VDSVSGVGVVDKSVAILDALATRGPLSLAGLVAETGLARPTAHRLAVALVEHGLAGRDLEGRFRLGLRLLAWGTRAAAPGGVVEHAQPVLARLRDETGESAQLYVRDDDRRVCVAAAERPSGLRDTVPIGARLPLDAGSGGTVLRAWAPSVGVTDPADPELAAVRARGWAESVAEREAGVASVSAPVLDGLGVALAAVSVSGPIERLGRAPGARHAAPVVAAARALEAAAS
jgi:DNA-binding IclR family transcriptional regulator